MQWNCEILPKLSSRSNLRRRLRIFQIYSQQFSIFFFDTFTELAWYKEYNVNLIQSEKEFLSSPDKKNQIQMKKDHLVNWFKYSKGMLLISDRRCCGSFTMPTAPSVNPRPHRANIAYSSLQDAATTTTTTITTVQMEYLHCCMLVLKLQWFARGQVRLPPVLYIIWRDQAWGDVCHQEQDDHQ